MKIWVCGLLLAVGLATPAQAWPADADERAVQDHEAVRRGVGDLFQAAKAGHPSLLQDAEREIVAGLVDGLVAANATGRLDRQRYAQVLAGYDEAQHLFRELPYSLQVDPGGGLRPFTLPLRRHPMWDLSIKPPQGWQVEAIESGVRLVPRGS